MASNGNTAVEEAPTAAKTNVGEVERWVTGIGGGTLAVYGLVRRSPAGAAMAVAGGSLVYRSVTAHCPVYDALGINTTGEHEGVLVQKTMTVNRSAADLYQFWHDFKNLPRFMRHLEEALPTSDGRSHWIAKAPLGKRVEWDAVIVEDQENELIAWESLPGSAIENSGSVRFQPAPGGRGTEVRVRLEYKAPAGGPGILFAKTTGEEPAQQVREDLRHFKQMMEAGEVPTTEGQPSGQRSS